MPGKKKGDDWGGPMIAPAIKSRRVMAKAAKQAGKGVSKKAKAAKRKVAKVAKKATKTTKKTAKRIRHKVMKRAR